MALYQDQFDDALDQPERQPERTLVIASSPRCGSHMLGHSLTETGRLGVPFEYLNARNLAEWQKRLGAGSPAEVLAALMRVRTTPNGVFAIKAHYTQTDIIGGAEALLAALPAPRVVHIERRDLLRQAISYARARQTGVWISGQQGNGRSPRYDRDEIEDCLIDLARQNAAWRMAIASAGVPVLRVSFEDASRDIAAHIRAVAGLMEIELPEASVPATPPTARQSREDETAEWIARYLAEMPRRRQPAGRFSRLARRLRRG